MIIDTHCHLHDQKFDSDRAAVIARAQEAGVEKFITIGCDIATTARARDLAHAHDNIYFTAGFHPHDARLLDHDSAQQLSRFLTDEKCVAVGEIGLDYYYQHSDKEAQKTAFATQLQMAIRHTLPVVIHLRDAYDDCVELLKRYPPPRTVIHCFSGTLLQARAFVDLGCSLSISGIVTFKKPGELLSVAQSIPLEHLMIETDCPYLAPHPYRGKRNEPSYIVQTLNTIASVRKLSVDSVAQQLYKNSVRFFSLDS